MKSENDQGAFLSFLVQRLATIIVSESILSTEHELGRPRRDLSLRALRMSREVSCEQLARVPLERHGSVRRQVDVLLHP
jgi:hypothetical protein